MRVFHAFHPVAVGISRTRSGNDLAAGRARTNEPPAPSSPSSHSTAAPAHRFRIGRRPGPHAHCLRSAANAAANPSARGGVAGGKAVEAAIHQQRRARDGEDHRHVPRTEHRVGPAHLLGSETGRHAQVARRVARPRRGVGAESHPQHRVHHRRRPRQRHQRAGAKSRNTPNRRSARPHCPAPTAAAPAGQDHRPHRKTPRNTGPHPSGATRWPTPQTSSARSTTAGPARSAPRPMGHSPRYSRRMWSDQ